MNRNKPIIGVIAVENKQLAIFGSNMGFLGPVIQHYQPFEDEAKAIEDAKALIASMGLPLEEKISRPRITSMRFTSTRRRKP